MFWFWCIAGNPLAAFGGQAAIALNAAIAQNKALFKKLPIGPIGSYLQLTDVKWAKAVEAAIGRLFNTYLVHCDHDLQALKVHPFARWTRFQACDCIHTLLFFVQQQACLCCLELGQLARS